MQNFFSSRSVAVIGASGDKNKVGYSIVANLLSGRECRVYPVTLNGDEILGLKVYRSVADIEDQIDLAMIAVKAPIVPQVLEDCGKKGIVNAIIISSGFKEVGEEGKALEEQVKSISAQYGIKVLGPNCLGLIDAVGRFNASFAAQKPLPGKVAVLSQSGALGTSMLDWAYGEMIGFSKFISLGNESVLSEIDFLEFLKDDPETEAILVYLEKIDDGRRFFEILRSITPHKPVVLLRAGVSGYGASAIMSHTGSLAPESRVFESACAEAGALVVPSLRKFFNMAKILSLGIGPKLKVRNLAILTNGGGPSVIAADEIGISNSLSLTEIDKETKSRLRAILPPMAALGNPIDILGDALADRYEKALEILCQVSYIDGIMVMLTPQMMTDALGAAQAIAKFKGKKSLFPVFLGGPSVQSGREALRQAGMVSFSFTKDVTTGLDDLAFKEPKQPGKLSPMRETPLLKQMPFREMESLFSEYGLTISGRFLDKKEDLEGALRSLSAGPYAMKAVSSAAVHKTEAGTVRLGVSFDEAGSVWEELWTNPNVLGRVEGVVVQSMEKGGREAIIGMKRDVTFGPTILFGLGGIFTEALKDTSLRIAPVEREEAIKMMREIKGIKILDGMRGEPPVSFDMLADIMVKLSKLSIDHPEIKEIDLNPVIVDANRAVIVDARAMTG